MSSRVDNLLELSRSEAGRKWIRYTLTSVIAVFVHQAVLAFMLYIPDWTAKSANLLAASVAALPSYLMNRYWAWGKRGRSHLLKEVLPFWGLALLGLVFSTWAADWAETQWNSRLAVLAATLGSYGVLWVGKFIIFNEILFKHRPEVLEDEPALDGRAGVPT